LEALQNKIISGSLAINSCRLVNELKTFVFNAKTKRAEALKGKHDDAVMSMCIALYVRDKLLHDLPVGMQIPEETTQIFKSDLYDQIKKEMLRGIEEDILLDEDTNSDSIFNLFGSGRDDEIESEAIQFRRKQGKLLAEFGW
jgi:hypothetical protein